MAASEPTLERELGFFEATVYGVGLILGAGIYAVIGAAAGLAGGSVVLSFLLAAVVATLTGLSYAELASMFPRGEGDYIYVREAFGSKRLSEVVALLRILVGVVSAAAVALAFAGYLTTFARVPATPVAVAVVVVASAVNYWGIEQSARVNVVFTALEVLGLVVVVAAGWGRWGTVDVLAAPNGVDGVVGAAFLVFFAYVGFGSLVTVAEETRDATREIPRAIVASIAVTTALYLVVAVSTVAVLDYRTLGASDAPLADVVAAALGPTAGGALAVIALFSTANTVLILLVSTSRMLYGVSKAEHRSFPTLFSRVHPRRRTPHYAVALAGVVTAAFTVVGDVGAVASVANLFLLVVFVLVNAALLRLRVTRPDADRGFTAPLSVGRVSLTAAAGLLASAALGVVTLAGGL